MTSGSTVARPDGAARPGLLELGLALVVAAPWLASTVSILSSPFDLGFTTSNLPWQLLLAWALPTALLALAAAVSPVRIVARCAIVAAGIEVVGLLVVTVVQLVLGAEGGLVVETLGSLAVSALAAVAAALALAAARASSASRVLRIVAVVVALLALVTRQGIVIAATARVLIDIPDPTLALPLLGWLLPAFVLFAGVAIAAVRHASMRWIAGAVIVASVVLDVAMLVARFATGVGDVGTGFVIDGVLTLAGGVLVGCSAIALSRSRGSSTPPAWATQQQGRPAPGPTPSGTGHLPPPVQGTQVPPPGGARPQ